MFKSETEPFTFSDYLNSLPARIVLERFVKRSGSARKIISGAMVKEITERFSTEKNLLAVLASLSAEAQLTAGLAYLNGSAGVPMDIDSEGPSPGFATPAHGSALTGRLIAPDDLKGIGEGFDDELLRSFIVYAGKDAAGAMYYAGFEEFEPLLRRTLAETMVQMTLTQPEKEASASAPYGCLNDVGVVVALASQGKLAKTKAGGMSKASNAHVNRLLHGAHARFDTGRKDLNPCALPLRFALHKGLIRDDASGASHRRMLAWLDRPPEARYAELVDFAFAAFPLWNRKMIEAMLAKPEKPWLSAAAFGRRWKDDVAAQAKMLAYCGLVDFYRSGVDCVFTRSQQPDAAHWKQDGRRIIIQPDFSAMLPQETSPEHLYWFSKVGRLESLDTVYRGMIAKDVVCNSLCAGIAGADIIARLIGWTAPINVVETVREWIREFDRVSLWNGSIVVSSEEKVTRQLSSYEPLMHCIEPIKADCVFRVIKGKEAAVEHMLTAMSFDPRPSFGSLEDAPFSDEEACGLLGQRLGTALTPVVDFEKKQTVPPVIVKQGKYSPLLKALDLPDLTHVIDYALLMGNSLRVEYAGSPKIRKGTYVIRPLTYKKGTEPQLEAETESSGAKKLFLLACIRKIGVEPDNV